MNAFKNISLITIIVVITTSCVSQNTRTTIIRDIAIGAAVGALIGQTKSEHREAYTSIYASTGAAVGAITSVYLNVSNENFKKENDDLKIQIQKFEKQLRPELIKQGNSLFNSPLPSEVASLVEPGEWKRYKLDQWVQDQNQPNTWYRQVEMFEIIPPVAK